MLVFFSAFASLSLASWATSGLVHAEDAAAPAAAAAAAAPDPTKPATGPDATGNYPGAVTSGALTKDKDKVTQETIIKDTALLKISLNIVWLMVGGFLVMYMQTGFALLETGLCRSKNAAHTMAMNFVIYGVGVLGFWACGYAFQMGGVGALAQYNGPDILHNMVEFTLFGKPFKILGYKGFFLSGDAIDMSVLGMFLFQMVFMDTAATIPTGAMAERWRFSAFMM